MNISARHALPVRLFCLPIVRQTKLVGALYLENNLTPRVFTPDRVTVLQLLASQAAISLENAALYSGLQRSEGDLARISRVNTMGELTASVTHEVSQPISGVIINANVCRRMLRQDPPHLGEVRAVVDRIVRDAERAAEIINRVPLAI